MWTHGINEYFCLRCSTRSKLNLLITNVYYQKFLLIFFPFPFPFCCCFCFCRCLTKGSFTLSHRYENIRCVFIKTHTQYFSVCSPHLVWSKLILIQIMEDFVNIWRKKTILDPNIKCLFVAKFQVSFLKKVCKNN